MIVGLAFGWCLIVLLLLGVMHSGSFITFNQSFEMLVVPVVGLLSIIGFLFGLAGCFIKDEDKTSVFIGTGINGITMLICGLVVL